MNYKELYDKALWDLEHDKITLGEFEKMIEPLNKEIQKEEQTDGYLISREVVIEWLKGKDIIKLSSQEETARKELKELSSVESAEKTAKWIFIDNKKIIAKCSNCWLLHDTMYGIRYCPNCGRRMKGVD